jgi:2-oxoisovalerate dehydrogenase E1 component
VIACEAFSDLDAPIQRLATLDIPIPYNVSLMESVILSKERIQMNIKELLDF